jgi:hypothetical protein
VINLCLTELKNYVILFFWALFIQLNLIYFAQMLIVLIKRKKQVNDNCVKFSIVKIENVFGGTFFNIIFFHKYLLDKIKNKMLEDLVCNKILFFKLLLFFILHVCSHIKIRF